MDGDLVKRWYRKFIMSGSVRRLSSEVAHLPYDLVFKILLLLPAKVVYKFSFVCKTWYNLINSSAFIEAHLSLCETSLIFLNKTPRSEKRPNTFSIETQLGLSDDPAQFRLFVPSTSTLEPHNYIHFLELFQERKGQVSDPNICGLGEILAMCNGLILATTQKNQRLIVMNPVTRKLRGFPLGTIMSRADESYGFIFDESKREYKVVHLYRDLHRCIGCEVLSLRTRSWRAVDGPTSNIFRSFKQNAVTASGALYWLPANQGCSYLVSMGVDDEKFVARPLPVNSSTHNDKLIEIKGRLSFVTHVTKYRMQVWTLKGNEEGIEDWVKQYTINMANDIGNLVPFFATRNGSRLVFKRYNEGFLPNEDYFFAYDFQDEEMKKFELGREGGSGYRSITCLPYISSLASWEDLHPW